MLLPMPIGGPYPKPPIPMLPIPVVLGGNIFPIPWFIPNGLNPIGFSASFSACSVSFFSLF